MFSSRTEWDLARNRLARGLEEKRTRGATILDLTLSDPTRAGIPYPPDLLQPLGDAAALVYEPAPRGLLAAREAVAADYRARGLRVEADDVLLTASTSEAYAFLFKLLCDPGDEVLVPRPSYPLFDYLAGLESVRPVHYVTEYDGEWRLDLASLRGAAGERTRAVVVVQPNNPTGSCLHLDEASALYAFCAERSLALVGDEVFADYATGDPRRLHSVLEGGPALAFALGGLSKSCGLPQLKLGWIVLSGPAALKAAARERLEVVADTYLSVSTPVQRAAPALLARRAELQSPIAARLTVNRAVLERATRVSPATLLRSDGGWYAVLQVPATRSEEERVTDLLARHDVLVHPGYFFDFAQEAFLVLSLLPPPEVFAEGVRRLLASLQDEG